MKRSVIIVAAGRGTRIGGPIAKQFLPLGDGVVLMHTIEAFVNNVEEIVVVVPRGGIEHWAELCAQYDFSVEHTVVEGDDERFLSVKKGLEAVSSDTELILVHDGVRSFVSRDVIERVCRAAADSGAVVPVVPISDSLRKIGGGIVSRSEIMAVQTPQGFLAQILRESYEQDFNTAFTDDASVVESRGYGIEMVEGDTRNFKITNTFDIELARFLIKGSSNNSL